jgi:perosamine synthetase
MSDFIPVAAPALIGNEKRYVMDCLESSWISSNGKYIELFEKGFADFLGLKNAVSCCNGTVALHLALLALGVGQDDEVIVPSLTYVSSANAVMYCGAKPVFVDSEDQTWNLNPDLIEASITERTRGIIVVHLYGHPADMDPVLAIAKKHHIFVIEDSAEAHGAEYKGRKVGTMGDIATFSFYGNKIISTGEGGMVCTLNDELAARVRQLKGQGQDPKRRFWFPMVGYNYRMTNIEAAIGLGQLEKIDWHIARRQEVASWYRAGLYEFPQVDFSPEMPWARSVFWLSSIVLEDGIDRDIVMSTMLQKGVETRPFFYPMHSLPIYQSSAFGKKFPVADRLARQGMNLPSSALLTQPQVDYVINALKQSLASAA